MAQCESDVLTVEEAEAALALSIFAEAGTKDQLSRGLGCAARLKVEPPTAPAIAVVHKGKDGISPCDDVEINE